MAFFEQGLNAPTASRIGTMSLIPVIQSCSLPDRQCLSTYTAFYTIWTLNNENVRIKQFKLLEMLNLKVDLSGFKILNCNLLPVPAVVVTLSSIPGN